ncbi:unnamed protein product [Protopolystoma xenopodis]|uniref:Uncharacterized protein n=1 Tax=Protopolystoma xenopodis TaxID=117903 RepID=A0A3S5AQY7_9PLAT|nr:unnamed protein product [Protopolystoma xenopodis]
MILTLHSASNGVLELDRNGHFALRGLSSDSPRPIAPGVTISPGIKTSTKTSSLGIVANRLPIEGRVANNRISAVQGDYANAAPSGLESIDFQESPNLTCTVFPDTAGDAGDSAFGTFGSSEDVLDDDLIDQPRGHPSSLLSSDFEAKQTCVRRTIEKVGLFIGQSRKRDKAFVGSKFADQRDICTNDEVNAALQVEERLIENAQRRPAHARKSRGG